MVITLFFVQCEQNGLSNVKKHKGHEYVDLGLSVKWAICNVGATKPEDYGDYFAWGELEPKEIYDNDTYRFLNIDNHGYTKYNDTDGKIELELEDDVAHVNWGGKWRTPTKEELDELKENCTWTWTTHNGVNGCLVTSNIEGYTDRSIFVPAAGRKVYVDHYNDGTEGGYWSASLFPEGPTIAYNLYFGSNGVDWGIAEFRHLGFVIRPVCE